MRKYLSIALIIATGLSLSSCGSPPKVNSNEQPLVVVPITYPPPASFTVVVPIAYWNFIDSPETLDPANTPKSDQMNGTTPIEYLYNKTCGGLGKSELTYRLKEVTYVNPPPGKEFVASKSSTAATLQVVLTGKQVYDWMQDIKRSKKANIGGCTYPATSPEQDYVDTIKYQIPELVTSSEVNSTPPVPVTTVPQILPWSTWLPLLHNAVNDLSNNLSICNLGYGQFLAGTLSTLANQAPDQNGMNVLYSDVQNLSQDASSLATRAPCWETKNSFNDDLKQLVQDLKANGYVY